MTPLNLNDVVEYIHENIGPQFHAKKVAKITGLTFHDSRATACTHLARKMDVLTLSKISRHRDLNVLRRKYCRETAEQISTRLGA